MRPILKQLLELPEQDRREVLSEYVNDQSGDAWDYGIQSSILEGLLLEVLKSNQGPESLPEGAPIEEERHPIRNWTVHNLIAHPVSEVLHLSGRVISKFNTRRFNGDYVGQKLKTWSDRVHEDTVPRHEPGTGRG